MTGSLIIRMLAHVDWWKLCALNIVVITVEEESNLCFLFSIPDFQVSQLACKLTGQPISFHMG